MGATGLVVSKHGATTHCLVPYDGVLVREGHGPDIGVLKEWGPAYRVLESRIAGHVVLDVGANIGMFSTKALALGAVQCHAYEPEPGALTVLTANLAGRSATVHAAAVGAADGTAMLSVAPSGNAASASTAHHIPSRLHYDVEQVAFQRIVELHRPSLVKVDCEGAELDFLDGRRLPACVRLVAAELHREHGWEQRCQAVMESFAGWREVCKPKSYSFHRCWMVYYER